MTESIPVLDFSVASLEFSDEEYIGNDLRKLGDEVISVFKSYGFLYIKNHGVTNADIEEFNECTRLFFNLPDDVKRKYLLDEDRHGWSPYLKETANIERPGDLKESFNVRTISKPKKWPEEVPNFENIMIKFFTMLAKLALRTLRLIAIGLKLDDPGFFEKFHNCFGEDFTCNLRTLWYPSLIGKDVMPNQIRCGEHADFDTITVLFQDATGGLEVMNKENKYVPVTPRPDCALINVGSLMQKWSNNILKSTMHRVVAPIDDQLQTTNRRSLVFFLHPENSATVKSPLNEDDEPINAGEFARMMFAQFYESK